MRILLITAAILSIALISSCDEKKSELSPDLNAAIDCVYRMEGDPIQERDVKRMVEQLFLCWVRDPSNFAKYMPALPLGEKAIRVRLYNELSLLDPLDLNRFGALIVVEEHDAISLLGKRPHDKKKLRLYMIYLPESARRGLRDYPTMAKEFFDDLSTMCEWPSEVSNDAEPQR